MTNALMPGSSVDLRSLRTPSGDLFDPSSTERSSGDGKALGPTGGTEVILLVEDEELVNRNATRILRQYGYTVLSARSPQEAFELFEKLAGKIDLLLTDVIMPDMNGRQVALELEHRNPSIRTIYMSGYPEEVIGQHGVLEPGLHFLPKPFSSKELAAFVRKVLDR